jgi:hypothetical protein
MQLTEQSRTNEWPLGEFSSDVISRLQSNHLDCVNTGVKVHQHTGVKMHQWKVRWCGRLAF